MRGGLLPRASEELEEKEQEFASRQRKEGERPLQLAQGAKLRLSDASQLWGHTGMYPELQVSKAAATAISSRVQVCLECVVEASEICSHRGHFH